MEAIKTENKKSSSTVIPPVPSTTQLLPLSSTQIDTPNDHNCLFWSAALALLVPLLGESETDKARFKAMYALLFGTTGTVTLQGGSSLVISADSTQEGIRQALKTYNFSKQDPLNFVGNPLHALIAEKFRHRVVSKLWEVFLTKTERTDIAAEYGGDWDKYIEKMRIPNSSWGWGGEPEIRAMSALVGVNITVYGEGKGYPKNYTFTGASQSLSLVHVSANSKHSTVKNHYHYSVENRIYQAHIQNLRTSLQSSPIPVRDKKEQKIRVDDDASLHRGKGISLSLPTVKRGAGKTQSTGLSPDMSDENTSKVLKEKATRKSQGKMQEQSILITKPSSSPGGTQLKIDMRCSAISDS